MILETFRFNRVKPAQNFILCEHVYHNDVLKFKSLELIVPKNVQETFAYTSSVMRVITVPKKLIYGKKRGYYTVNLDYDEKLGHHREEIHTTKTPIRNSMPWRVEQELLAGDIVWVNTLTIVNSQRQDRVIECEDRKYYLIPYDQIYLYKRGDNIKLINGWILLEPEKNEDDEVKQRLLKAGIIVPSITIDKMNQRQMGIADKFAVVRYIGEPVFDYIDGKCDSDDIAVGDRVVFKFPFNRRLESEMHRFFDSKELIVSRRVNLVCKIVDSLF